MAEHLRQRLWRLSPGHPSSPYDANGALRPPVPDPWARDVPNETVSLLRPDRKPEPDRATAKSWLDAYPRLVDLWEKHQDKWPDTERQPADNTQDEPGSWRGDSGQYLNYEENLVADHAKERIGNAEKQATPALMEIGSEVPGAQLAGLEFRLKGDDRFKEKLSLELRAKPERSMSQLSENMPDAIRYTYQFEADRYVSGYWEAHRSLTERGYSLDFRRNSWDSSQYRGINTRWRASDGQLFEVQFHTPASFQAKQLTHRAYERIRSDTASDQERDDMHGFMREVSREVPVPRNALTIPDYRDPQGWEK